MPTQYNESKPTRSKFMSHVTVFIWKSALQRRRRWKPVLLQTIFAGVLYLIAIFIAKPVLLTPLRAKPEDPLTSEAIVKTLSQDTYLGFSPAVEPYVTIMRTVSRKLNRTFMTALTEEKLSDKLYERSRGTPLKHHVIWVIWKPKEDNVWKFRIRCTELVRLAEPDDEKGHRNRHLRVGFLALQLAVSEALLEDASTTPTSHQITLEAMPMSPLMREDKVRKTMAWILLCFTLAFIPPVMEISALVVTETANGYKRALRIRNVGYSSMYIGWLVYAFLTALPICILASLALIVIFRWIMLFMMLLFVLAYMSVMIMLSLIMSMFHSKAHLASIWSGLFTLLQLFLAELLVHHGFDDKLDSVSFILHVILPPLGLVHGFNSFALLKSGRGGLHETDQSESTTVMLWMFLILFYFAVLMLLQRTIGQQRAIGGQVSWKSIIFKKAVDVHKLRVLHTPTGKEREKLQEVDELVAKAISFRNVSKSIMGTPVLTNITLDIYRGEYTLLFAERIQERLLNTIEDLITGLTSPDKGVINVLGYNVADLTDSKSLVTHPGMIGYCHRSPVLVPDLTVLEQLQFFVEISIWQNSKDFINEYFLVRSAILLRECDLEGVRHEYVKNLDLYYRAQLCWAIAILLEPRIVYVSNYLDGQMYIRVINDKIVKSRSHIAILKLSYSTFLLEHGDRVFFFDHRVLVFGGTPAYMFFKYGREYRVRMTFRGGRVDDKQVADLLRKANAVGARVRAHLGSLLILRLPTSPTANAAEFVKDLTANIAVYGITSLNISLPDSEEICRRAVSESRNDTHILPACQELRKTALNKIAEPREWKRRSSCFMSVASFKETAWKFICFYVHYRFYLIVTIIAAIVTGVIIGVSLSVQLTSLRKALTESAKVDHGEKMTVESLKSKNTLVIQSDSFGEALNIATAYALSHTKATGEETKNIDYTAFPEGQNAIEYLILRAIDSPQHYVYMYAYGLCVTRTDGIINLRVLYSPVHHDGASAARSLARTYMALMRHYSGSLDADIEVTDDPLVLDLSPMVQEVVISPLIIQFMLIITISHITLLPSKEHGLIRHMQAHAMDFSPARYWFSLFCLDLILYWTLVAVMTSVLFCVVYLVAPAHFMSKDLIVIPFTLIVYGLSCVPQAYLFSLGPSSALNSMTFIIINIVFGEATVLSQILYGQAYSYAKRILILSPQYNVANAFIRMTQIFVYNSECVFFQNMNLCSSNKLHKCCEKCGVMQACYQRISYLTQLGILDELVATLICGLVFTILLVMWEYKVFQRLWRAFLSKLVYRDKADTHFESCGTSRQYNDVAAKHIQIQTRKSKGMKVDTYGEYLLVHNLSKRQLGSYILRKVSFGVGKGQALALAGLKRHGRLMLCHILAGYELPSDGDVFAMSKWNLSSNPHKYSRNVALCCFESLPLPPWMTVYDALAMIAILRGVPKNYVHREVTNYVDALELHEEAKRNVCRLQLNEITRVNFAAAAVGAPPVLVLDECTAYQKFSVNRAMYFILYNLRKQGHGIFLSSANVESHMPVTNQLAFLLDGEIFDIDHVDNLVERYSQRGYTVVVHLKDELDVYAMFANYFKEFAINDTADVLVNMQVLDDLDYAQMFERMEQLLKDNTRVYSYIISAIPLDYIYNKILLESTNLKPAISSIKCPCWKKMFTPKSITRPSQETVDGLEVFEKRYDITTLKELPWSVIFQR